MTHTVIPSYTVPYGFLYGSPCRKICPTLPHIGSHMGFTSSHTVFLVVSCVGNFIPYGPVWFPLWATMQTISPHADSHGFLYGILLFPTHSHGFPCNPMLKPIWEFAIGKSSLESKLNWKIRPFQRKNNM